MSATENSNDGFESIDAPHFALESLSQESSVEWNEAEDSEQLDKYESPENWLDNPFVSPTAVVSGLQGPNNAQRHPNSKNNENQLNTSSSKTPRLSNRSANKSQQLERDTTVDFPGAAKSRKRQRREVSLQRKRDVLTPPIVTGERNLKNKKELSPLPNNGSADFDDLLQQVQTPQQHEQQAAMTVQSEPTRKLQQPKEQDDEFASIEFSMDDLATMDSLIMKATQGNDENTDAKAKHDTPQLTRPAPRLYQQPQQPPLPFSKPAASLAKPSSPVAAQQSQPSANLTKPVKDELVATTTSIDDDDPFGDFPDIDFAEIDKLIVERKQGKAHVFQPQSIAAATDVNALPVAAISATHQRPPHPKFPVPPAQSAVRNLRTVQPTPALTRNYLSFSRYKVMDVTIDHETFTKSLSVAAWTAEMTKEDPKSIHKTDSLGHIYQPRAESWPTVGVVHLRGEWYHTPLFQGDVIHICSLSGRFRTDQAALPLTLHTNPPFGSDPDDLVLIVLPDLLLTPTTISETVSCTRRAILKNRLGSSGLTDKAPLFGTMRHQLFEETMRRRDFSTPVVQNIVHEIVRANAEGLLACGVSSRAAETEILKFVPQLRQFAAEYTDIDKHNRKKRTVAQGAMLLDQVANPSVQFLAKAVEAIEEPAISPELGLKGNIDMIVNAVTAKQGLPPSMSLFGVELKTGHNQTTQKAHMAQLVLYILMLQARYGSKVLNTEQVGQSGILLYLNGESLRAVNMVPTVPELKTLIGQRNMVAIEQTRAARPRGVILSYDPDAPETETKQSLLSEHPPPAVLPELQHGNHTCSRCYANRECMMYAETSLHSSPHGQQDRLADKEDLRKQFTGHLTKEDFDYFSGWDRLIDLEAHAGQSLVAEAWLTPSETIEKDTGKCLSNLVFEKCNSVPDIGLRDFSFADISFKRSEQSPLQTPLSHLGLEPGCNAIISVDRTTVSESRPAGMPLPRMHIVRGILHRVSDTTVTVKASRDDLVRVQRVASSAPVHTPLTFRIDRDSIATGTGTLRQNLINFFTGDTVKTESGKSVRWPTRLPMLRDIVVRGRTPIFLDEKTKMMFTPDTRGSPLLEAPPGCDFMDLAVEFAEMNPDQKAAIQKVMAAQECSLIQGLPGTGKSEVISFIARLLAAHGKRVLISAYTHSAVDNVMMKLLKKGLSVTSQTWPTPALVRVGRTSSCHPDVRFLLVSETAATLEPSKGPACSVLPSAEHLRTVMKTARVVGATALSVPRSPLLLGEHFDVVIVDEAGQISQPAVLGALMAAESFVLVGDHMQLPPLVTSELAAEGGFGVSMLKRLAEAHPESMVQLTYQYRMHEDICQLSNDLVYGGRLKCANEEVRRQQLQLPVLQQNLPQPEWLTIATDPTRPVVFLNTDSIHATSSEGKVIPEVALERTSGRGKGGSIVNDVEANLVRLVVQNLISRGLPPSSIGVVCPFRAQLRLLDECALLSQSKTEGLEISTIDRYQGRDKPAIVLSFVRSNHKHKVGRLLEDVRRLNVAVSRAKCKLVMIGSFSTLFEGSEALRPALDRILKQGKIVELPNDASPRK